MNLLLLDVGLSGAVSGPLRSFEEPVPHERPDEVEDQKIEEHGDDENDPADRLGDEADVRILLHPDPDQEHDQEEEDARSGDLPEGCGGTGHAAGRTKLAVRSTMPAISTFRLC